MNKTATKHSKKEEQKKLMVRVVCLVLVAALVVTSMLTVFTSLLDTHDHEYTLEDMVEAGILYLGEDGNYYVSEDYLTSEEDHTDHDHD